ncbi:uncharacterized protein BO80DRAFT_461387 [Aspergillus ibericus CBS 121593]|uniref:Uncharacterized protein n=1 Tax=Aspergillus ibericus CBS 121593 TaxID=1448316 RepID=A0A395HBL5_9EURO|nr:hypothetical protein BO80DRAFT_461387 [Aspergillus ibericus CBS 121593]RAL04893.1 hypothetical protein BO80DRAFT_461387 [Aspergillus ibericus CBS 121593]
MRERLSNTSERVKEASPINLDSDLRRELKELSDRSQREFAQLQHNVTTVRIQTDPKNTLRSVSSGGTYADAIRRGIGLPSSTTAPTSTTQRTAGTGTPGVSAYKLDRNREVIIKLASRPIIERLRATTPLDIIRRVEEAQRDPSRVVIEDRERAVETCARIEARERITLYTDGSGYRGHVGAVVITPKENGVRKKIGQYMGPETISNVYAAELRGLQLATTWTRVLGVDRARRDGEVHVFSDSQAALKAMRAPRMSSS